MAEITFTQADLDNLKEALVSGASSVTIGDRTVTFRTKQELIDLIGFVKAQLNGEADDSSPVVVGGFSRKPSSEG